MSFTIVKCDLSHLDALVSFYDEVIDYLDATVNYPLWVKGVYPAADTVSAYIERGAQFACFDGGRIVGAFALTEGSYPDAGWSVDLRGDEYLVIHSFATHPDLIGGGVGRQVLEWCIDRAKSLGYRAMRLDVVPNNPSVHLYERLGFKFVGLADLKVEDVPEFELYELNF